MAEMRGISGVLKVPVAATPTALAYEINCELNVDTSFSQALNKASGLWVKQAPTTQVWNGTFSAHLDDTTNPALDVIKNASLAQTKLADVKVAQAALSGWTFTGDAYIGNFKISNPVEGHVVVSGTIQGAGALVAA